MKITEALAELKTLQKRLDKKRDYVLAFITRPDGIRDPLEREGGSPVVLQREKQAISDLETRMVAIRTAIQTINLVTIVNLSGTTKTVSEWLTWRKEVSVSAQNFLGKQQMAIQTARHNATRNGAQVVPAQNIANLQLRPNDILVNLDEGNLHTEIEQMEKILGDLDGQLSLINAVTDVTV